jgi:hypothetical protein
VICFYWTVSWKHSNPVFYSKSKGKFMSVHAWKLCGRVCVALRSLLTLAYLETNGQLTLRLLYPHGVSFYSLGETQSRSGSCGENCFNCFNPDESATKICQLPRQYRSYFSSRFSCGDIKRHFLRCKDSNPWCPTCDTSL